MRDTRIADVTKRTISFGKFSGWFGALFGGRLNRSASSDGT